MSRLVQLRRFASGLTIFMLLWCQTCAAVQGSLIALSAAAATAVAAVPCHTETVDTGSDTSQHSDCPTRCQSRDASFETAKIQLPALNDLPLAVLSSTLLTAVATCAAPNDQTVERAAPPPLILVYCRLLI